MAIQLGPTSKDKDKILQISHFYTTYQIKQGWNKQVNKWVQNGRVQASSNFLERVASVVI